MSRITRLASGVLSVLAFATSLAFAQDTIAIGKKGEVELRAETRVGSSTLKPGHYVFQQQLVDGQHYLLVRAQSTARSGNATHYAGATKGEVARVPCRVVATPNHKETRNTALYTKKAADGIAEVTRIDIRGEQEGHVVTLEPQS